MISDGVTSPWRLGTYALHVSCRRAGQKPLSHVSPDSMATTFRDGYFANAPSESRLCKLAFESGGLRDIVLDII